MKLCIIEEILVIDVVVIHVYVSEKSAAVKKPAAGGADVNADAVGADSAADVVRDSRKDAVIVGDVPGADASFAAGKLYMKQHAGVAHDISIGRKNCCTEVIDDYFSAAVFVWDNAFNG